MGKNEIVSTDSAEHRFEIDTHVKSVGLTERMEVVVTYRRFIVMIALTVTALGVLLAFSRPPVYESNLLIHVADMRSAEPRSLLGQSSPGGVFKTAMSEVELLRSRAVIGSAVERLGLDLSAAPHYFPVFGEAIARWNIARGAPAGRAWGGYAWGAETIRVGVLEVPPSMVDRQFTVTRTGASEYRVDDPQSGVSSVGRLGRLHEFAVAGQRVALRVDELAGGQGTRYLVARKNKTALVEDIAAALQVDELGRATGMIRVGLQDTNPRRLKAILDEIGSAYMGIVQAQKGQAVRESEAVLRAQLPVLEKRVASAEASYESYRRRQRAADLQEDTKLQLVRYSETQTRLAELRQKRAEVGVRVGDAHPEAIALDRQIARASSDGAQVAAGMQRLPAVSTELERLARDLKADTDIYNSVVRRIEELSIDVQDQSSNVRIVDQAVVPVRPSGSPLPTMLLAAVLGLVLGTAGAFVRRLIAGRGRATLLDTEEQVEGGALHCARTR